VRPILERHWPGLPHSAARLGEGSDVLGYDTPRSTDHGWGPKLDLYLTEEDEPRLGAEIGRVLAAELPREFRGYSTHFGGEDASRGWLEPAPEQGPVRHGVRLVTVGDWCRWYLGFDPRAGVNVLDWLTCPAQRLRTVQAGRVFHDGLGQLEPVRAALRYYPRDVWLYMMAAQWRRIAQEEPFMGRAGDAGDELGSRVLAARLAHEVMRLAFLQERAYPPYSKWFGTAFKQLACARFLADPLAGALEGGSWREREEALSRAYAVVAGQHNALRLTAPLPVEVSPFFDRPYRVIHGDAFADALLEAITDPEVRRLPAYLGSVDEFVDSTDVLENIPRCRHLQRLYKE